MKRSKLFSLSLALLGSLAMTGCGNVVAPAQQAAEEPAVAFQEEPKTPKAQPKELTISKNKDVANYIKNMDFDPEKVWQYDLTGSVTPKPGRSGSMSGDRLMITKKEVRDAKSGTASLHSLNLSNLLYPGQLLKANSKLVEGVPTAITDVDRGKATYEVVLPGLADNVFSIEETTSAMFRSKLGAKVAEWKGLGKKLTANQTFSLTQTFDAQQLAVDLGFGIGEKLKIDASYKQGGESNIFIAAFEQIFYSVNVVVESRKSTVIFDEEVTLEEIQKEITPDAPPLLITQANYGQTIYLKIETSMNKDEVQAGFSYAGRVDVSAKAQFQKMLGNCKVNCLVYGGVADDYEQLTPIVGEDSADKINELLSKSKTPLSDQVENAILLSYATSWLKNSDFARIQATTKYIETTYEFRKGTTFNMHNRGVFTVKQWKVSARKLKSFDADGNAEFGDLEVLYNDTTIFTGQDRAVYIPANYGQVEFGYDVKDGSDWPFNKRIWAYDFFESASVKLWGTTYGSHAEFKIDNVTIDV